MIRYLWGGSMSNTTKNALAESLKTVLVKKPLDKVTIADITDNCGVNRMTFYYHFQDIYDLVEWVCVTEAEKALAGKRHYDNWQEGFYNLFLLMIDNKPLVTNVYHSMSREHIDMYIHRLTEALFIDVIDELCKEAPLQDKDKEFIASFYIYAFSGVVLEWIEHNMKEDPEDIINRLSIITEGNMADAIKRFSNQNK